MQNDCICVLNLYLNAFAGCALTNMQGGTPWVQFTTYCINTVRVRTEMSTSEANKELKIFCMVQCTHQSVLHPAVEKHSMLYEPLGLSHHDYCVKNTILYTFIIDVPVRTKMSTSQAKKEPAADI